MTTDADRVKPLVFAYTNYRGEHALRKVLPLRVWFGSTEWHPEPQWLLRALDLDKGQERDFALSALAPAPQAADAVLRSDVERMLKDWQARCSDIPDLYNQGNVLLNGLEALPAAAPLSASPVSPSDPLTIIAGIRQFGLAADGADLRDLEAAIDRLRAPVPEGWVLVPKEPPEAEIEAGCRAMHEAQGSGDADAPRHSPYQKSWDEPDSVRWKQWDETVREVRSAMLAAAQEGNGNV